MAFHKPYSTSMRIKRIMTANDQFGTGKITNDCLKSENYALTSPTPKGSRWSTSKKEGEPCDSSKRIP